LELNLGLRIQEWLRKAGFDFYSTMEKKKEKVLG
jgi:hypothetical protein